MKLIKKIVARLILTGIVFLLSNFIYEKTFWKKDIELFEGDILIDLLNAQDSADVIYLGESSNYRTHEKDTSKKSISDFTADYFPHLVFKAPSKGAAHAATYLSLIYNIKNANRRVQTLIITLNLRSFDADWINSKLETSLQQTSVLFQNYPPLINRFLLSLNAYDKKTEEQRHADFLTQLKTDPLNFPHQFKYKTAYQWDSAMAYGAWGVPKVQLGCHYIKAYGFQINTETNPRIKDLDKIVRLCKQKNVKLVFNLLAENIQYADSLVGKDLVFLMKQNRDLLMNRYNKDGVLVVDNLELVCGKDYIDQDWTTEHYNQTGRMKIAKNLAKSLKTIYSKEFKDLKINIKDCSLGLPLNDSAVVAIRRITEIENSIRATPEWMKKIKIKAKERKVTVDEMINLDAKYMYDTEVKPKGK